MTKEERVTAEKCLARFGNSIVVKDYGLALQIMHNQIIFAQKEAGKNSANGILSASLPSEPTDVEVLIELHKHLDICGHNINSNLKERLREIINRYASH